MEKDIHASHKGQGAATNREKGQGVTRTRAGAAPCKNGLVRTLYTFVLYLHSLAFYIYVVGPLSKLAYTVHISSAEGYTNTTFCVLCGINSKHSDI